MNTKTLCAVETRANKVQDRRNLMFDSFKKAYAISILFIVFGSLLFLYHLLNSLSFSVEGIIIMVIGLGLLFVIKASKFELNKLRLEDIEMRKRIEEIAKYKSHE